MVQAQTTKVKSPRAGWEPGSPVPGDKACACAEAGSALPTEREPGGGGVLSPERYSPGVCQERQEPGIEWLCQPEKPQEGGLEMGCLGPG